MIKIKEKGDMSLFLTYQITIVNNMTRFTHVRRSYSANV